MESIRVYSWKPEGSSNFGDEIGPMIVAELCRFFGKCVEVRPTTSKSHTKLLAVGSVLHEARGSDVVWGVGINSKNRLAIPTNSKISFKAVRGPLTRSIVLDNGFNCPPVYGDPGLLFPMLFDAQVRSRRTEIELAAASLGKSMPNILVIPNINDDRFLPYFSANEVPEDLMVVRPNIDPITMAAYISASEVVVASSLHGLVFAEAYGRKTIRMTSQYEPEFKYTDYYNGTGRDCPFAYANISKALNGVESSKLNWDPLPLLEAFPLNSYDLTNRLIERSFTVSCGKKYLVKDINKDVSPFGDGWSDIAEGSIWTVDTWSNFDFVVTDALAPNSNLRVKVGTLEKGKGAFEILRIVHNGKLISSTRINRGIENIDISIPLPQVKAGEEINLSFKVENASSPKEFNLGIDERKLGVWISEFEIVSNISGSSNGT